MVKKQTPQKRFLISKNVSWENKQLESFESLKAMFKCWLSQFTYGCHTHGQYFQKKHFVCSRGMSPKPRPFLIHRSTWINEKTFMTKSRLFSLLKMYVFWIYIYIYILQLHIVFQLRWPFRVPLTENVFIKILTSGIQTTDNLLQNSKNT